MKVVDKKSIKKKYVKKIVKSFYYRLKDDKIFNDTSLVEKGTLVRRIIEDDKLLNVETMDLHNIKRVFWIKEDELEFISEEKEIWNEKDLEEREKIVKK